MDTHDISACESGFCLSVNRKKVISRAEKVSDLLEIVSELMDEEAIKTLSRWNFAVQPRCSLKTVQSPIPTQDAK